MIGQVVYDSKEKVNNHFHETAIPNEKKGIKMEEFTVKKNGILVREGVFCPKCFLTKGFSYEQEENNTKPFYKTKNRSKLRREKKRLARKINL